MKLLRYGPAGAERPGVCDESGAIRDLSGIVDDIAGDVLLPASLRRLMALDIGSLPLVSGQPRLGPCVGRVAGYCVANDVSERAFQLEGTGQWMKGKSADSFGPIGPWLVTADEAGDWSNLNLWLDVDGWRFQNGSTRTMVFGVPFLISYLSRYMSLQSGDLILTGTPPGVGLGKKPPVYLRAGQEVRLGIQGLGEQHQYVVA